MVDSPQSGQDQLVLNQVPSKSIEQLPNGPCTHIEEEVATRSQRSSSDSSTSSKKSKLKKLSSRKPTGDLSGSNWRRLRNTLKAASEMQTKKKSGLERQDSFLRKFSTRNQRVDDGSEDEDRKPSNWRLAKSSRNFVIQHDGKFMFYWLGVMTVAVLYNLWTCIAREAFREIQSGCNACWYTMDAFVDLLYILDVVVQFRTGYLDQGLMVYDSKKLAKKYISSRNIYFDTLCLVPSDLLQFYIGIHPMIRFPRFLKVYRTFRFIHMLESKSPYPNLIRVANLSHMLFLGAHWFAAFYYLISEAEGFIGGWSYPKPEGEYASVTRKYLASLFWSTLTLTTIGDLPPPDSNWDWHMSNVAYVFVIVSYLIGVFIFATIVGQVGNVINNRNASRQEFERLLDGAKLYMQTHNVPPDLQKRVQRWYDYVWSRGRLNGCDINSLGLLPDKLKTELAIHVNLETLKKVTIFQECQPEFLHDLVLKMRAYIFTPGDLICRRGEVAREMFIVADGVVEVISEAGTVLKRMAAGDFFGEIGILNLDGGINRRTADVRSVGYSELFVLSREDVLGALKDHPDAESIIRDYGQRRLREIEAHRQRVKPLQREDGAVKNAFLMTLRSMSPKLRRHDNSNSPSSPRFSKTPSVKNTNFSFNSEDAAAFESEVKYSQHNGIFETVCGNLRRLFHRKVRRQKGEESLHLDNKAALVSAEEQAKSSVTPEPTAENEPLVSSGKESLIAQVLKLKKKPGYMAVKTDDQESCDSDNEGTKDDSKDNQIIDLTLAGKMKQLKVKQDEEKQLRTREYTPPSCKLPSSRECTPSPTSKQSSSREFSPTPIPSSSSKQSSLREFTPPPLPTSSSSGSSRARQFTPPPVDNVKKFDIPRCKSTSASDFGRDDKRLALRLSSPPRDYVAHISTPPLASSNPTYSILTPPPAKSSHSYTHDPDVTSGSPRKCSIFVDDDGSDLLAEAEKRRNCFKRHSVDMSDTRLNPILHRHNSNLSVTSQYQITNELQRLCQQLEDFTKVMDKKMSTLEEAVTGSMSRMDKMTSVQENLVTTLQDNFKLLQSKAGEERWEHTTPL